MTIRIVLPEPPSANVMWRSVVIKGQVRVLLSAEGRQYKQDVRALWLKRSVLNRRTYPADAALSVTLIWNRARKAGDLDNRIKSALDALKGLVFVDDDQITQIHAFRAESPRDGSLEVTVTRLETP